MSFGMITFTNRGRALQAKAAIGTQLKFTRIAVGDGQLSGQVTDELVALIHEVKSLNINELKIMSGNKAKVGGILTNQGLASGFFWREIGVFAQDPDVGEILYCYGNAGALAEYIPSQGSSEILERQVNVVTLVGNASNITAVIDQSLIYANQSDIVDLQNKINGLETVAKDYTDSKIELLQGSIEQLSAELDSHLSDTSHVAAELYAYQNIGGAL